MLSLIGVLIPMCVAASVSPMMLSEQLVLLGGRDGRRMAISFAAGTATVLLVLIGLVLTVGGSLSLPHAPKLSARMDVVLGIVLLGVAAYVRSRPGGRPDSAGAASATAATAAPPPVPAKASRRSVVSWPPTASGSSPWPRT